MFRWQNVLLSDSSSDEDFGHEIKVTDADVRSMLRNHVREKKAREAYSNDPNQAWASSVIFLNKGINQRELDYIVLTRISWHSYNTVSTNVADIGKTSTCYSVALLLSQLQQYQYYSTGLLSNHDKYSEKAVIANKARREQKRLERQLMKASYGTDCWQLLVLEQLCSTQTACCKSKCYRDSLVFLQV